MLRSHANELQEVVRLLERRAIKLEHQATTDALTGIANRQKFEKRLKQELYRVNRYGEERLSLLLVDLDHFKQVNDSYGHPIGDRVLKEVVALLREGIRATDLIGRWGGEEFILMLPLTGIERARLTAERLRHSVAEYLFPIVGHLSVSIGVAEYRRDDELGDFIEQADEALYQAKDQGRNRVVVFNDEV